MKSRRHHAIEEKEEGQERWLVSYADFMTLMFAFFAVLYFTAQKDVDKTREFQESIKRYLIKAGVAPETMSSATPPIKAGTKGDQLIEPPIEAFNPSKIESANALDEAETFLDTQLSNEEKKKYILDLAADDWGVRITLPAAALFSPQSEKFRQEALPFIAKLSGLLKQTKRKILIEGHVAENETGAFKSTWEFASARSLNLLRFVQKKENLAASRLASVSLADSRPLGGTAARGANSRLEIVLLNSDFEL